MDENTKRQIIGDVCQALEIMAKYGTEKATIFLHYEGKDYKGVKIKDWEKRS